MDDPQSIFTLPEVRDILASPAALKLQFAQRPLGQYATKPTKMLTLKMPSLRSALLRTELPPHALPRVWSMMGGTADGAWASAAARTSTFLLCALLLLLRCVAVVLVSDWWSWLRFAIGGRDCG